MNYHIWDEDHIYHSIYHINEERKLDSWFTIPGELDIFTERLNQRSRIITMSKMSTVHGRYKPRLPLVDDTRCVLHFASQVYYEGTKVNDTKVSYDMISD